MARRVAQTWPPAGAVVARVEAVLQAYADRGVFRGYSAADGRRGGRQYRFAWLTRRPMQVTLSPPGAGGWTLTFVELFPGLAATPGLRQALGRELAAHATREVPAHRRLDPRRARLTTRLVNDALTIRVTWTGRDSAAVVRTACIIVNDLFQYLHECYPDYLSVQFGTPDE